MGEAEIVRSGKNVHNFLEGEWMGLADGVTVGSKQRRFKYTSQVSYPSNCMN